MLADQLRLEAAFAVARDLDRDRPLARANRLLRPAVATIRLSFGRRITRLVAQVMRELSAHRAVHQPSRQLLEQAIGARNSRRATVLCDQLIQQLVRTTLLASRLRHDRL